MTFFPKKEIIAGIDITSSSIKIALLRKKRKGWEIFRLEEIPHVNPLDNIPKEAVLATAISNSQVLVRRLELPLKNQKDIDAALPFQAEPLLPFPVEKSILQSVIIESTKEGSTLSLHAIKKDHMQRYLHMLKERQIEPEMVTSTALALAALSIHVTHSKEMTLVMHCGEKEGTLALVQNGRLLASKAFENDKNEIQKAVFALNNGKKIDAIILISEDPYQAQEIQELTGKTVVLPKLASQSDEMLQKFGLAIAIAYATSEKKGPNFRQQEFTYPHKFKRLKKPLLTYFALIALLSLSLFALEKKILSNYEQKIFDQAVTLFEKPSNKFDLMNRLEAQMKELEKRPDTFALLPQLPKVSDILAYISNSPETQEIKVESFDYNMVTRPSFERKSDRYQIKVTLCFTADPNSAERFRQALQKLPFVDGKKEIDWVFAKGKYSTTFFLKDKTRYCQ